MIQFLNFIAILYPAAGYILSSEPRSPMLQDTVRVLQVRNKTSSGTELLQPAYKKVQRGKHGKKLSLRSLRATVTTKLNEQGRQCDNG